MSSFFCPRKRTETGGRFFVLPLSPFGTVFAEWELRGKNYGCHEEMSMKKLLYPLLLLACVSCVIQTVETESSHWRNRTFDEVWEASIDAVNDIEFTIDSLDRETGFIGAESGRYVLGGDAPPRLSIMIREHGDSVSVDCRVLQKEQFVDIFRIGKKIVREFMIALNQNLSGNRSL
jgi:hypothetical protein